MTSARTMAIGLIATLGAAAAAVSASPLASAAAAAGRFIPLSAGHIVFTNTGLSGPPTTAECESGKVITGVDLACYRPFQIRDAFDLYPLYSKGNEGQGETIVIVDSFGSPTVRSDLATFDAAFGLPAPPSFKVIQPVGTVPPCSQDPYGVGDCEGWGGETTLDVEWSHVIAPLANILLVETPSSETEGVQGLPDMMTAENYVISHHLGDVISQSFGATEQTFLHDPQAYGLRSAYINAAQNGVTVLASSGDDGATDALCVPSNRDCANFTCCYSMPVTDWPASDPLVTGMGGVELHLDASGATTSPPTVWNDPNSLFSPDAPGTSGASGGGESIFFSQPGFQSGVASVVNGRRGVPDISMSAAEDGSVVVYQSGPGGGWGIAAGTSEASPEFAGIIALTDQMAGHSIGYLNPKLYQLAEAGGDNGIVPISGGDNTFSFCDPAVTTSCKLVTVNGFSASGGYNLATGWGTIDAAKFVPALAAMG